MIVRVPHIIHAHCLITSFQATAKRASLLSSSYSFPPVPSNITTFVAQGLAAHPTFFGCNSSTETPLVIYLANGAPPPGQPAITNTSTEQLAYLDTEIEAMLDETFAIALQGNPALGESINANVDPDWPACLACAVVDRARNRSGVARSGICETCFSEYCWNGTEVTTSSSGKGSGSGSNSGTSKMVMGGWTAAVAVVGAIVSLF